jgi:hypothetical protein
VVGCHPTLWTEKAFFRNFLQCVSTNVYTHFAIVTSLSEVVNLLFAYTNPKLVSASRRLCYGATRA